MRVRVSNNETEEREDFGPMTFRVKLTCPACDATCEIEAKGYRATRIAAEVGHAFLTKHNHMR